jgi:hypothetical protein
VLARALALATDGLPQDFAAHVAALAEAGGTPRQSGWNDIALLGAFAAMIGVCVAGWFTFGPQESDAAEWFGPIARTMASQPWLLAGAAGVAIVQVLTFRRRAAT